jgi:hypothetical protein
MRQAGAEALREWRVSATLRAFRLKSGLNCSIALSSSCPHFTRYAMCWRLADLETAKLSMKE